MNGPKKTIPVGMPDIGAMEMRELFEAMAATELSKGLALVNFEDALCEWTGREYAVALSSGTDGLTLALKAAGAGPGKEVIVPTMTFAAVAAAVVHAGAEPVFVGSGPDGCMSPDCVNRATSDRTAAVIAVHSYGREADIHAIVDAAGPRVDVIVDASQGHGIKSPKGICDTDVLSFHGNKIVTTGEGGCVATDDEDVAYQVRHLATHAQADLGEFMHDAVGHNCKMTNIQAAVGVAQLERWPELREKRQNVYDAYVEVLGDDVFPCDSPWLVSVHAESKRHRDRLCGALKVAGIEHRAWFPLIHTMAPYRKLDYIQGPHERELSETGISLPTFGDLTIPEIDRVCEVVLRCGL